MENKRGRVTQTQIDKAQQKLTALDATLWSSDKQLSPKGEKRLRSQIKSAMKVRDRLFNAYWSEHERQNKERYDRAMQKVTG